MSDENLPVARSPVRRTVSFSEEQPGSDAGVEFAGMAKKIVRAMHEPDDRVGFEYNTKLIHSYVQKGLEMDVSLASAIPFTMVKDYEFFKKDSKKAEEELKKFQLNKPATDENEIMQKGMADEASPDEIQAMLNWKAYRNGIATIEGRILSEEDRLSWDVMQPFCEGLPEKYLLTTMAREGLRGEHGKAAINAIVAREQAMAEASGGGGMLSKLGRLLPGHGDKK